MKINDEVWFFDKYGNLRSGKIVEEDKEEEFYTVQCMYIQQTVPIENCFSTVEKCMHSKEQAREQQITKYMKDINSVEDLVRFMYTHAISCAEEYTDWEARDTVKRKAIEFGIDLEN